jgi:protoporphyrin/coproporphyrin ferrochelatase
MRYFGQTPPTTTDRHAVADKIGVLLINLGTPESPTPGHVRRYLRTFLSDPRVIELPRVLWWLLLNLIILPIRGFRSARNYQKVWTKEGSPLLIHTKALANGVARELANQYSDRAVVEFAMSYSEPNIPDTLKRMTAAGARRLVVIPLYPQYSGSTTGSVFDAVTSALQQHRWVGDFRFVSQYYERADYIQALADSVRAHWQTQGRGAHLLLSFHGIPERYFKNGDLYHCHCYGTARRLMEALGLDRSECSVSFQSRVGREKWLAPYTDETVKLLAKTHKTLDVLCPGFAVDCLETLEEIAGENSEYFTHAGGEKLNYIAALNADPSHVKVITQIALDHAAGWPEWTADNTQIATERTQRAATLAQKSEGPA